ncbi:na+ symporter family protein, partial [Vibrio parahaemolyticus V-223/04]
CSRPLPKHLVYHQ